MFQPTMRATSQGWWLRGPSTDRPPPVHLRLLPLGQILRYCVTDLVQPYTWTYQLPRTREGGVRAHARGPRH